MLNEANLEDRRYHEKIDDLVNRYKKAESPLMKLADYAGTQIESVMSKLPDGLEAQIQTVISESLETAYNTSNYIGSSKYTPDMPGYFHRAAATISGAIGGVAGLPGALIELPVTITTMFAAFQKIALEYEFDPNEEEIKAECIRVFSMGGPISLDEDKDLSFLTARIGLQGEAVTQLITKVAHKLGMVVSQKLASQAIPIVGAVTGATINYTFMSYYEEMAHIRFSLRKLQQEYPSVSTYEDFVARYDQTSQS